MKRLRSESIRNHLMSLDLHLDLANISRQTWLKTLRQADERYPLVCFFFRASVTCRRCLQTTTTTTAAAIYNREPLHNLQCEHLTAVLHAASANWIGSSFLFVGQTLTNSANSKQRVPLFGFTYVTYLVVIQMRNR